LGWSAGAVKGRLERGRLLLRDRLARRGVALSVGLLAAVAAPAAAESVPSVLVDSTVQAALSPRPAGALAALLARGAPMTTNRRLSLLAALSAAGLIALAAGGWTRPTPADPPPAAPAAAPAADAPATVTVSGRVFGPDGKPFAGARIHLPLVAAADDKIADE